MLERGRDQNPTAEVNLRVITISVVVVVFVATVGFAQSERSFPLRGVVTSEPLYGLMLRVAPPEVSGFHYRVGNAECGVGNGGKFVATEEVYVANGEIWFKVEIQEQGTTLAESCSPQSLPRSGWMVAKLRDRWVVTVTEQSVALPSPAPVAARKTHRQPSIVRSAERGDSFAPLVDTALLVLGTVLAVCVVAIRRARALTPKTWVTRFVVLDLLIVVIINVTIAFAISDLYVGDSSVVFHTLNALKKARGGLAIFGFVLSLILLNFMSFAEAR